MTRSEGTSKRVATASMILWFACMCVYINKEYETYSRKKGFLKKGLTMNEYAKIRRSKKKDTIITEDIMFMVSKVSES